MSVIDEIKERIDIVELINEYGVNLHKNGSNSHTGFCPFHRNTNTPAFVAWQETGTWKCFSCTEGGDAFTFVMKKEGVEFKDALRKLAQSAGVELKPLTQDEKIKLQNERNQAELRKKLFKFAADYYQGELWRRANLAVTGFAFVAGRRLAWAHVRAAGWGFSDSGNGLLQAMAANDEVASLIPLARQIGLIRADGRDFTANADGNKTSPYGWIIYPHHHKGVIESLSARAAGDVSEGGKTRNLPGPRPMYWADGPLTDEAGHTLFDLHQNAFIITEGVPDAETLRAAGYRSVALMGNPPSQSDDPRLEEIQRRARNKHVFIATSNDSNGAGRKFADTLCDYMGALTRVVFWPRKPTERQADANSLLQEGASYEQLHGIIIGAPTYLDVLIDELSTQPVEHNADKLEHIAELVATLGDTERALYTSKVASQIKGVSKPSFEKMVKERIPRNLDNGIKVTNGELVLWSEPLVNGVIKIDQQLTIDDGLNAPTIAFCVSGRKASGEPLRTIDKMPAEEFESSRWLVKYWGADMYSYLPNSKYHTVKRAIIEHSAKEMQRSSVYVFTGWHGHGGKLCFLSSSGALNSILDTSARVDLDNNLAHYKLPEPPVGQELCEAIMAWLRLLEVAHESITVPLMCAMHAAPFTSVKSLNTIMDVYGKTQAGKSSLVHLFLTAFGEGFVQERDYKAPQNWSSTFADLEGTLFTCKDVPLVIDDYVPQVEPDQIRKATMVIRALGNRAGKGRRWADGTARNKFMPRGLVIMTAEQPLNDEGIVGRVLYINVAHDAIDKPAMTKAQDEHHLYSQMMAAFISYLSENWDKAKADYEKAVNTSLLEVKDQFKGHTRLCDYYAILNAASIVTMRWMHQVGAIDSEYCESRITLNKMAILEVLESQELSLKQQSPVFKFFTALDDLITQGRIVFAPKGKADFIPISNTVLAGWRGENNQPNHIEFSLPDKGATIVWLLLPPALKEVKSYLSGLDEPFNIQRASLARDLNQTGYIARRDGNHIGFKLSGSYEDNRALAIDGLKVFRDFGINLTGIDYTTLKGLINNEG